MSVLIAYGLIGLIMGLGLIIDRNVRLNPDSLTDWAAAFVVLMFATGAWPTLFTRSNMEPSL